MYPISRARGIVLDGRPRSEGDKECAILTDEFGLVWAHARSVREERSKLRYALQNYTIGTYAFIRGKSGWRIVGAQDEQLVHAILKGDPDCRAVLRRLCKLVTRLVHGEGRNSDLFEVMVTGLGGALREHCGDESRRDMVAVIEMLIVLRVLFVLGYISKEDRGAFLEPLFSSSAITQSDLGIVSRHRSEVARIIHEALSASHL